MLSTADEHLCLFHSNGIVESISIYILVYFSEAVLLCVCVKGCVWSGVCVCVCVCVYEGVYIPWSGMAGPCSESVFNFLRNHQAIFHSGCIFCIPTCDIWGFQVVHLLANTCLLLKKKRIYILVDVRYFSAVCVFIFCFGPTAKLAGVVSPTSDQPWALEVKAHWGFSFF